MEFNREVADWVYTTIAKMDEGEAELFTRLFADDLYEHQILANSRLITRSYDTLTKAMTDEVAADLLARLHAGEDPERLVAEAAAVSIAKAHDKWKFQDRSPDGRWGRMTGAQYRAQKRALKAEGAVKEADLKALKRGRLVNVGENLQDDRRETVPAVRRFEEGWNAKPSEQSRVTDTFGRIQAAGDLAAQVGAQSGNPKLYAAGQAAALAGRFGPEAEKVIGPSLRRTAYRYRGTERTPDKKLATLTENQARMINLDEGKEKGFETRTVNGKEVKVPHRTHTQGLDASRRVYATEQASVQYLLGNYSEDGEPGRSRVPSARRADLQRQSGRVTPSEGVLIDRNGRVVAQAVGYAEDHYLPFNLKNLGALQGGSYVRTRESGGLTSEDIYTGLMSGARSMTVVSNSGIFTVDFAQDLRGGRRYNDKARQMVGRYEQTLDAVKSEKVANPSRKLSPAQVGDIKAGVDAKLRERGLAEFTSDEEKEKLYSDAVEEFKTKPQLSADTLAEIKRRAETEPDQRSKDRAYHAMYDEQLNRVAGANYKLDGEGYGAALEALAEQFPYYVDNVSIQHRRSEGKLAERFNTKSDKGYVKPNYIRPEGARTGYFDESIEGRGKGSADKTLYQNWGVNRPRTPSPEGTETEGTETTGKPSIDTQLRDKQKTVAENEKKSDLADKLKNGARVDGDFWVRFNAEARSKKNGLELGEAEYPRINEYANNADDVLDDPTKVAELAQEIIRAREARKGAFLPGTVVPDNVGAAMKQATRWDDKKLKGEKPPEQPMALESAEAVKARQEDAVSRWLGKDDKELYELSTTMRVNRRKATSAEEPEMVAQYDAAIRTIERARAVNNTPVELSSEQFAAASTAANPTGSAVATGGNDRFERNAARMRQVNDLVQRSQSGTTSAFDKTQIRDQIDDLFDQLEEIDDDEKEVIRQAMGLS